MSHFIANIRTAWTATEDLRILVLGRFEATVSDNGDHAEWELFHRGTRIAGDFVDTPQQGMKAVEDALRDELGLDA